MKHSADAYHEFVGSLFKRDMIEFKLFRKEEVGAFFVRKKSGKLRLVIDARHLNSRLVSPPCTLLASTAAMVENASEPGECLYFSAQDIADCFYQFSVPSWMIPYMGMKPVTAGMFGICSADG